MLGERIQAIIKEVKIKQRDFAASLGLTEGYVSKLVNGANANISITLANLIQEKYGFNTQWVIDGTGEKYVNDGHSFLQRLALKKIETLTDSEVKAALAFLNALSEIEGELSRSQTEAMGETIYNYYVGKKGRIAGGHPILAIEEDGQKIGTNIRCDVALDVVGDSMAPDYPNGSTILVKCQEELVNGDLGVILVCDGAEMAEATFKRFYLEGDTVILKPINPAYDPQLYPAKKIRIYGKVVGMA
jgi:SOS-response transcriptional repressor LexA